MSLTWGEGHHKLRAHYIVTNTHPLVILSDCPVAEAKWARSQTNRDAWTVKLLSKKSCTLTIKYSFWPSVKQSS